MEPGVESRATRAEPLTPSAVPNCRKQAIVAHTQSRARNAQSAAHQGPRKYVYASPRRAAIVMRICVPLCLTLTLHACTDPRPALRAAEPKRSTGVGLTPDVSQPGAFQYPPPSLRPIERAAVFVCVALGVGCTEAKFCSSPRAALQQLAHGHG